MSDYWDDKWQGPYTKIPWSIVDEPWAEDSRKLARWLRNRIAEDRKRRGRRRVHLPVRIWRAIQVRFNFACAYCGATGVPLEKEHRMPIALGGPDVPANIVPACKPCNRTKRTDHPDLWPLVDA